MKTFQISMTIKAPTTSDSFQLELLDLQSDVELTEAFKKVFLTFEVEFPKESMLT